MNNQENVAFLETGIDEEDPNYDIKEALLIEHDLWSPPYPYSDIPTGLFLTQKGIPAHVISYLRIKFWRPSVHQKKTFEKMGTLPNINPKKQLTAENEKKVLEHIIDVCVEHLNRYPQSYKEDQEILKDPTLTLRQKIAVMTRLEEKNIYNKVRNFILSQDHRAKSGEEFDMV